VQVVHAAFAQVLGPFRCISVISKFVASSAEWCDNNAFAHQASTVGFFAGGTPDKERFYPSGFPDEFPFKQLKFRHGPLKSALRWRETRRLALFFCRDFHIFPDFGEKPIGM
jgi:hypothetical protein